MYQSYTSYFSEALHNRAELIADARKALADVEYDTLVGTGLSGAIIVPELAEKLGKYWAIVRKDGDGTHSSRQIEGTIGDRWIFVDDLIDTGNTVRRVKDKVRQVMAQHGEFTEYVGTYTYHYGPNFRKGY